MLRYEVIWGHIDILVVAVRSLSRSEQVENSPSGPQPYLLYEGGDYHPLFPTHCCCCRRRRRRRRRQPRRFVYYMYILYTPPLLTYLPTYHLGTESNQARAKPPSHRVPYVS